MVNCFLYISASPPVTVEVSVVSYINKISITLDDLLERYKQVEGVNRVLLLADIRRYVSRRPLRSLLDEFDHISDSHDCDVLLGAGMKGQLYMAVVKQKAILEGI